MIDTYVILTGASRGIGAALAQGLLKPGTRLVTLARRTDEALAKRASELGAELEQIAVDLSDSRAATEVAQRLGDTVPHGAKRYLLINNAGTLAPVARAADIVQAPAVAAAFGLNVTAVMLLSAHFLRAVEPLAADRRILNISSGAGRNPNPGWAVYCATKAALDMYSRVVKAEQGADGVRIVSLAPGVVDTDMQASIRASDPQSFPALERFKALHENGQLASVSNVAQRILQYLNRDDFGSTEIDDIRQYD